MDDVGGGDERMSVVEALLKVLRIVMLLEPPLSMEFVLGVPLPANETTVAVIVGS